MSDISRIEPGSRMSQAVIYNGLVFLAGQIGAPGKGVTEQTNAILAKIDKLLADAGTDKSSALQATIWLADMDDCEEMNNVWDKWIDPANPPARACGESRLANPDFKVEIILVAAIG